MAVRLKIRGRLILSFSVVMMLVLSSLGYITYLTFADSIHNHKQAIASLKLEAIGLKVRQSITRLESSAKDVALELAGKGKTLAELKRWPFSGLALLDARGQKQDAAGAAEAIDRFLSGRAEDGEPTPGLFLQAESAIYVSPGIRASGSPPEHLVAAASYADLFASVLDAESTPGSQILLTGAQTLLNPDAGKLALHQRFTQAVSDEAYVEGLKEAGDVYAMKKDIPGSAFDAWYVLDKSVYLESIIELKNRIISATVIILWVSIWIVLVVAYRITRPIRDLGEATRDMQKAEYSVPLSYQDTGDEVSDLGNRFEAMRLHIEGLISRDPLSGLFNRRYLMNALKVETSKAKRGCQPLCCLMMDLDHFKSVNDTHGHQCGDEVIKNTAGIIQNSLRDYDICARYGGEEFVVILPMAELQDAKEAAERIRQRVQDTPIEWEGRVIAATLSIGVAEFQRSDEADDQGEAMISAADEALYLAKGSGRNCIMDSSSVMNLMG